MVRPGALVLGAVVGLWLQPGCGPGPFSCEDHESCTRSPQGQCEPGGGCSYPDDGCDSGRRFSPFSPVSPGECTEMEASGSTSGTGGTTDGDATDATDGSGDTGVAGCADATCSGHGTCVELDGEATCACEPGWYAIGTDCLEDPCTDHTCWFVDPAEGDDANDGSREAPWGSVIRLQSALDDAAPGDHFLLRRNRIHPGRPNTAIAVDGRAGSEAAPIVVGAYGPPDEPPPEIEDGSFRIRDSSHVVVRDLSIRDAEDNAIRPCLLVERSDHVTVLDNAFADCTLRGIRASDAVSYLAVVGNRFTGAQPRTPIFVSDTTWDPPEQTGSHHYIMNNEIVSAGEVAIAAGIAADPADAKILGNQIGNSTSGISTSGRFVWVVGNVVAAPSTATPAGASIATWNGRVQVAGNVSVGPWGFDLRVGDAVEHNTVIQTSDGAALELRESGVAEDPPLAVVDNLVAAPMGNVVDVIVNASYVGSMDFNAYAGDACWFRSGGSIVDFNQWRDAAELDLSSRCEPVAGIDLAVTPGDPPFSTDLYEALTPGADWQRCEDPAGARACDGTAVGDQLAPFADLEDNEGLGWPGPLVVQVRRLASP